MHDATKTLLGSTESSDRLVDCYDNDPASFPAGQAVRLKSDGKLSLAVGDGSLIGVSLGASLSDTKKTNVVRVGDRVPIKVRNYAAITKGDVTFTAKESGPNGADITIVAADTNTGNACAVTVVGSAISLSIDDSATDAAAIKTAIEANAEAHALIGVTIADGETATVQNDFTIDNLDYTSFCILGDYVYVSDVDGKACAEADDDSVITGATYISAEKVGIDGSSEYAVALIDMGGGL